MDEFARNSDIATDRARETLSGLSELKIMLDKLDRFIAINGRPR